MLKTACCFLIVQCALLSGAALVELPTTDLGKTLNGKPVSTEDFKGKVRILFFWTSSCADCMKAFPAVTGIQNLTGTEHLQVIAVNQEDSKSKFGDIVEALNDTPLVLTRDRKGKISRQFKAKSLPYFVIVDTLGKVAEVHEGYDKEELATLVKKIDHVIIASHEIVPKPKALTSNP